MLRRIPAKDLISSVSEIHWKLFALVVDQSSIRESDLGCGVSVHLGQGGLDDQIKSADENIQVMLSTTDDEFRGFVQMANWNYATFRSLFTSSYPSEAAAEDILQAYGIRPASSDKELFEAFSQFISDVTMIHKVHRATDFSRLTVGNKLSFMERTPSV